MIRVFRYLLRLVYADLLERSDSSKKKEVESGKTWQLEYALKNKEFEVKQREYALKRNEEVTKFLESKQKFTYFLITGSVAVVAFLVDFLVKNQQASEMPSFCLAGLGAATGIFTAGSALLSLHYEHESFKLHLKYMHEEKDYISLRPEQQQVWDQVNAKASQFLKGSFVGLFLEIGFTVIFFFIFFLSQKPKIIYPSY
jgi:hypothetical protein